ncbi:glycosyltransferase family 4 protein [Pedobacter aquatilis]|uniref:glycosyltransferase family 4 protein n=1 Tax=Pedobacter aquatilis TaxID=351343 RepID=UPI00292E9917|nr:glycosyltransferase family 4 protein [Pedobacter aquatilis]
MTFFRLAIVISHPIQYYAPLFKILAGQNHLKLKVFYTLGENEHLIDDGFKKKIAWDIPLLSGYEYEFLQNTAKKPGSHHFMGIDNPFLIDKLKAFTPNAILIYGWSYLSHFRTIMYFNKKIPLWFRGDSTLIDQQPLFRAALKTILLGWVYRHVEKAFFVGQNSKAYFKHYGLKEQQLVFAPHSIDNKRFSIDRKTEAEQLRKKFNISDSEILVLFSGKFEKKKDPLILLEAFCKLNKVGLHLLFVGNGVLEKELKERAHKQAGVNAYSNIHFLGFQNQSVMPTIYQACDLFCLPSQGPNETWGLSVNEAMASSRAILVSDKVGCAIDLVTPQKNGYIFKSNDLDDLTNKLDILTNNFNELTKMGAYSNISIQNWSLQQQAAAYIEQTQNAK